MIEYPCKECLLKNTCYNSCLDIKYHPENLALMGRCICFGCGANISYLNSNYDRNINILYSFCPICNHVFSIKYHQHLSTIWGTDNMIVSEKYKDFNILYYRENNWDKFIVNGKYRFSKCYEKINNINSVNKKLDKLKEIYWVNHNE